MATTSFLSSGRQEHFSHQWKWFMHTKHSVMLVWGCRIKVLSQHRMADISVHLYLEPRLSLSALQYLKHMCWVSSLPWAQTTRPRTGNVIRTLPLSFCFTFSLVLPWHTLSSEPHTKRQSRSGLVMQLFMLEMQWWDVVVLITCCLVK